MIDDRNAAAGLLTRDDLRAVGQSIARAWPVERSSTFEALLEAIEEADREFLLAPEETTLAQSRDGSEAATLAED